LRFRFQAFIRDHVLANISSAEDPARLIKFRWGSSAEDVALKMLR
jgi:hypothetical protein